MTAAFRAIVPVRETVLMSSQHSPARAVTVTGVAVGGACPAMRR